MCEELNEPLYLSGWDDTSDLSDNLLASVDSAIERIRDANSRDIVYAYQVWISEKQCSNDIHSALANGVAVRPEVKKKMMEYQSAFYELAERVIAGRNDLFAFVSKNSKFPN